MADSSNGMEGLKLISDWAKWLITVETAAIGLIGAYLKGNTSALPSTVKIISTISVFSFVASIASAALLLLSLPEIAQGLDGNVNIWLTSDSIIGRVFGANTQTFAMLESFFFGLGVVLMAVSHRSVSVVPVLPSAVNHAELGMVRMRRVRTYKWITSI